MASARPVIATEVGGVGDLMGEIDRETGEGYKLARHGILLPSGDTKAMAEALLFAVRERTVTTRMAERARKHVLERYSLERLVGDMAGLYEGLVRS
jgi:glycosyltransferase involved in cell wall biosynthesis